MTHKRFKLYAVCYDKRGRILSAGENDYTKSHPLMATLARQVKDNPEKIYLHAEVQALLRSGERPVHRLTVQRFNARGQPALAKPCKVCQKALELYGVKVLEYSTDEGKTKVVRLK